MNNLYIGLMSGTSMDGVDAALVDVSTHSLVAKHYLPYHEEIKARLQHIINDEVVALEAFASLNIELSHFFAQTTQQLLASANINAQQVSAIGCHGQTIKHAPSSIPPYTLQIGCPHTLSALTGITVVAEFRQKDMCLNGQGAPFAPVYHKELFHNRDKNIACVNIGGIANISCITKQGDVWGYDTGPGNCLMDEWINRHAQLAFDERGKWASQGRIIDELLHRLLDDAYFLQASPKSIGKEYFSMAWLEPKLEKHYLAQDVQATLVALTVETIAQEITHKFSQCDEVIVCGGGAKNHFLLDSLQKSLGEIKVHSSKAFEHNPNYIEAMMFAWLASKTMNKEPVDLTTVTNASRPAILGAVYYP